MPAALRPAPDLQPPAGAAPSWALRARGARLWDAAGRAHVDWANAGGAVLLGHADPQVEAAAAAPSSTAEACAADRLCAVLPGTTTARFTVDAASALSAAGALAMRATGRPDVVTIGGSEAAETLAACMTARTAAVVLGPDVLAPPLAQALRAMTAAAGVLLILDETATGQRRGAGGLQASLRVRADLSVWGAGLANGRALGALTGDAALLRHGPAAAPATPAALAAAAATLARVEREDVALTLAVRGAEVEAMLGGLVADAGLAACVEGDPTAVSLRFTGPRAAGRTHRFAAQLAARGVHARGPLHVGLRHEDAEIGGLLDAVAEALQVVAGAPAEAPRAAA